MSSFRERETNFYTVNDQQSSGNGGVTNNAYQMDNLEPMQDGSRGRVEINRIDEPPGCFVRRSVGISLVVIAALTIAIMGLMMAMYGPGNERLVYEPLRENPEGGETENGHVYTPPPCKPATSTATEARPTKRATTAMETTKESEATTKATILATTRATNVTTLATTRATNVTTLATTRTTIATKPTATPTKETTTDPQTEPTGSTKSTANTTVIPTTDTAVNKCDVVVLGGGIAGLYMAEYLLKNRNSTNETSVCVLERESRLGGRIYDVQFDNAPNTTAGLGAWKFLDPTDTQITELFNRFYSWPEASYNYLEQEKNIVESRDVVWNMTDVQQLKMEEIKHKAYLGLSKSKFQSMTIDDMLKYAFNNTRTKNVTNFATIDTYLSNTLSLEAEELFSDIQGLSKHYDRQASAKSYVEYRNSTQYKGKESYTPLPGMGKLIEALEKSFVSEGGKVYCSNEVKQIDKDSEKNFILKTAGHIFRARKVVIAAPPKAFERVQGNVAQRIKDSGEFQSIKPVPAFKGAAVYSSAWWENTSFPLEKYQEYISNSDCLGMTFPYKHRMGTAVLNVMYTTGCCAQKWGNIYQAAPTLFHEEIHRALQNKFGGTLIPRALESKYQYWSEGDWHFQKPGSNITLENVETWAKRPLPGEDLFLVGSAYHRLRGWCEGAIASSRNALKEGWQVLISD